MKELDLEYYIKQFKKQGVDIKEIQKYLEKIKSSNVSETLPKAK